MCVILNVLLLQYANVFGCEFHNEWVITSNQLNSNSWQIKLSKQMVKYPFMRFSQYLTWRRRRRKTNENKHTHTLSFSFKLYLNSFFISLCDILHSGNLNMHTRWHASFKDTCIDIFTKHIAYTWSQIYTFFFIHSSHTFRLYAD